MRYRKVEDNLFFDFEPLVKEMAQGLDLLDVEILTENKMRVIRAVIYKPDGITLDDCAAVQNLLGDRLDELDPFPDAYTLEVSSPGLERTLRRDKEFPLFSGLSCRVNLFAPVDGIRTFTGILEGLLTGPEGESQVALRTPEGLVTFPRENVSKVQLVYDFTADETQE